MERNEVPSLPETFEEATEWAKARERETGEMPRTLANPTKCLLFDLENSTVTKAVWDEDNNLVEMTYCAIAGGVLNKRITKARDINR